MRGARRLLPADEHGRAVREQGAEVLEGADVGHLGHRALPRLHGGALRDGAPALHAGCRLLVVELHDGALARERRERGHAQLGGVADDCVHLVALRQTLREHHHRTVGLVLEALRDAHHGQVVVEGHDLAFEVVARRVHHGHVLARRKPKHARVLRVVGREAQREGRRTFVGDDLALKIEVRQRHGGPS